MAGSDLRARVEDLIAARGAEVAVAFRTLDGTQELLIEPDRSFHAASTMKLPVMVELFRQHRSGQIDLDQPLAVRNEFASIVDGSPYSLDPAEDSEQEIYQYVGKTLSLRRLCEAMIVKSSNLATNLLIDFLGTDAIRATVQRLGAGGLEVRRGVEDIKAYRAGKSNTTTARALLALLEAIADGSAVDQEASREMIEVLARQHFNEGIPAGLPDDVRVAHKTGQITRIHHDAGIVEGPHPFVLVVLVEGLDDDRESAALIADIARSVYAAATSESTARSGR